MDDIRERKMIIKTTIPLHGTTPLLIKRKEGITYYYYRKVKQ